MIKRTQSMLRVSVSTILLLITGVIIGKHVSARTIDQTSPSLPGQGIPQCAIPKSFGRLVTFIPGDNTGIRGQVTARSANGNLMAGQAIFEAQDGTIRWIVIAAPVNTDKPVLRVMPRGFPLLPIYECAIGHVWQRP